MVYALIRATRSLLASRSGRRAAYSGAISVSTSGSTVKRSGVIEKSTPPYVAGICVACSASIAVSSVIDVFMAQAPEGAIGKVAIVRACRLRNIYQSIAYRHTYHSIVLLASAKSDGVPEGRKIKH